MRLKKGFTLAEILIVLMVIGVIATMTIPSMMRGVTESQYKAGFKKAYNTISNFAAMEKVAGNWPGIGNDVILAALYQGLNNALSIKTFAVQNVNNGYMLASSADNFKSCIKAEINGRDDTQIGEGTDCLTLHTLGEPAVGTGNGASNAIWFITEDNIAYTIVAGGAEGKCATKQTIAAQENDADAVAKSCYVLVADVNGLSTGPNLYETQGLGETQGDGESESNASENAVLNPSASLATLTGDQYKIYLGSDGATAGPRMTTVSGRIAADLK